jgi:thiosulfate/3-mercaptopyruvate sulfurtransferase
MTSKLISVKQLSELIQSKKPIHILDSTHVIPHSTPLENHFTNRIPGSKFLDMREISDKSSELTMTMPTTSKFNETMMKLRIRNNDVPLIIYDYFNIISARVWFMFKVFNRKNVMVLDGGLCNWMVEEMPVETGKYENYKEIDGGKGYDYVRNNQFLTTYDDVLKVSKEKNKVLLDARPHDVFSDGNIPGSINSCFEDVYNKNWTYKNPEELKKVFENSGVDLKKEIVNYCRTGVTASVNLFALSLIGKESFLYDGSWEEWSKKDKV